jgi:hypothetical protein
LPFDRDDFDLLEDKENEIDAKNSWENNLGMKQKKASPDIDFARFDIRVESVPVMTFERRNRLESINQYGQNDTQNQTHRRKLRIPIVPQRESAEYQRDDT